jgi:hypothetical protein
VPQRPIEHCLGECCPLQALGARPGCAQLAPHRPAKPASVQAPTRASPSVHRRLSRSRLRRLAGEANASRRHAADLPGSEWRSRESPSCWLPAGQTDSLDLGCTRHPVSLARSLSVVRHTASACRAACSAAAAPGYHLRPAMSAGQQPPGSLTRGVGYIEGEARLLLAPCCGVRGGDADRAAAFGCSRRSGRFANPNRGPQRPGHLGSGRAITSDTSDEGVRHENVPSRRVGRPA